MTRWHPFDPAELGDASNVLLVAPEVRRPIEDVFADVLSSIDPPPDEVVGVTLAKPPGDFRNPWQRTLDDHQVAFSFVSTANLARSTAAETADGRRPATNGEVVRLDDPRPLSTFYRAIAEQLDGDEEAETVLCVHSLTHLLEYVDTEAVFRLLHVLLSTAEGSGARSFVHIDGDIHDEETVIQLSALFDLVVEFDRDRPGHGVGG